MSELKPCPFCGGEVKTAVITFDEKFYEPPYEAWYLDHADIVAAFEEHCPIPTTDTFYDTEAEAIEAWNTRYDQQFDAIPATEENMARYGWVRERTCHDIKPQLPYFKCDVCGMADMGGREIWISDGFYRGQKPNYCPNCGAKVVGE